MGMRWWWNCISTPTYVDLYLDMQPYWLVLFSVSCFTDPEDYQPPIWKSYCKCEMSANFLRLNPTPTLGIWVFVYFLCQVPKLLKWLKSIPEHRCQLLKFTGGTRNSLEICDVVQCYSSYIPQWKIVLLENYCSTMGGGFLLTVLLERVFLVSALLLHKLQQ